MLRQLFITATLLCAARLPAVAQNCSSFSGTWVLNLAKSKTKNLRSSTIVITCSEKMVRFDPTINGKAEQPWIYTTDGKEHPFWSDEISKAY